MMKKLHSPFILLLLICIGFAGFAKSPQYTDLWSTPVSFDLVPVALVDLPDASLDIEKSKYYADFSNNSDEILSLAYVAPPCDNIGEACDDGNPNTVNDKVDADCECRGVAIAPSCDEVNISYEVNGGLREPGATAITLSQTDSIELFADVQDYVVRDPNGDIVPNNTISDITPAQAGDYTVNTTFKTSTPIPTVPADPILIYFSSEEIEAEVAPASNAFDGDPSTFWHTRYSNDPDTPDDTSDTPYPHELHLDMGEGSVLSGFSYLPRQDDDGANGRIGTYDIYVSNSNTEWGDPVVVSGTFENNDANLKRITFPATQGRYLRFVATGPVTPEQPWATAAEITITRATAITATASTSQDGHPASSAIDGSSSSYWHSQWEPAITGPHYITLDLGIDSNISHLEYQPRPVGSINGNILDYEVYMSNSPNGFDLNDEADFIGTWDEGSDMKTATFPTELRGRYLRLVAKSWETSDSGDYASAAEIRVFRPTVNAPCSKTITINVDPLNIYSFNNGTWTPTFPEAGTTANDIIIINQGNFILDDAMTCRNLIVNPGASLTLNADGILTATSTTLKSVSDSFSSLIVDGGELVGKLNYERWVNQIGTDTGGGNDLISSPVLSETFNNAFIIANPNLPENPDNDGEFAFAPYNVEVGAYENFNILAGYSEDEPIESGRGYRAATNVVEPRTGNTLTFTGSAATTDVTIGISDAVEGRAWNLIGNPYPSYLDGMAFLSPENIASMDSRYAAVYGYNGSKNGWDTFNLTDPNILIAPGQGFFVKAKSGAGDIVFTPAMRRTEGGDDFIEGRKENINKALSKLKLSTASNNVSTSIYFIEGTTKGLDPGYDAAAYAATKVDFSVFTNLLEDNSGLDIAIQSLPYNDFNDVIVPLGLQAKAGVELSISIDELSTLPSNINVYLEDTKNETLTLLNDGDFKFTPTTDVKVNGRFNVHYSAKTLSVEDLDANDNLRIYTTASPRSLFIVGQLAKTTKANLYDIQGRLVLSKTLNPNTTENTIDISTLGTGIYVVKVNNDNQIKTQKVIIK